MKRTLPHAVCLALAACASALAAQTSTPMASSPRGPDIAHGHTLSYTCQGCHGVAGYKNAYPNYHVPKIGGQNADYISQALTEYRDGKRIHPTMQAQASSFSDQDIADLAAYLSSLK